MQKQDTTGRSQAESILNSLRELHGRFQDGDDEVKEEIRDDFMEGNWHPLAINLYGGRTDIDTFYEQGERIIPETYEVFLGLGGPNIWVEGDLDFSDAHIGFSWGFSGPQELEESRNDEALLWAAQEWLHSVSETVFLLERRQRW